MNCDGPLALETFAPWATWGCYSRTGCPGRSSPGPWLAPRDGVASPLLTFWPIWFCVSAWCGRRQRGALAILKSGESCCWFPCVTRSVCGLAERIFFQQGRVARLRLSRQKRFAHSRSKQGRGALETSKITWLRVPVFSGIQVSLTAVFSDIPSLSLPVRYPL